MSVIIGNYENIADNYAQIVDTKPIHIYYERPSLTQFIPKNCANKTVLDLGCGSGWYSEYLASKGATVISTDASEKMVALTQARLNNKGSFIVHDLNKTMDFINHDSIDFITAPLLIHYIKEWQPFFLDIFRILKKGGQMCFSTHQPHNEVAMFNLESYFKKTVIVDYWEGIGEVSFYHHTLEELFESILSAGLTIKRIIEPKAQPELKEIDPNMYENISKNPWFLFGLIEK